MKNTSTFWKAKASGVVVEAVRHSKGLGLPDAFEEFTAQRQLTHLNDGRLLANGSYVEFGDWLVIMFGRLCVFHHRDFLTFFSNVGENPNS